MELNVEKVSEDAHYLQQSTQPSRVGCRKVQ